MSDYLPPASPPPPSPPSPTPVGQESGAPVAALVLGILSIFLAGVPVVGLVLGIIGLKKAKQGEADVRAGRAPAGSSGMVTAGKVCSIVGTCLAGLATVFMCLYFSCIGAALIGGAASASRSTPHTYHAP